MYLFMIKKTKLSISKIKLEIQEIQNNNSVWYIWDFIIHNGQAYGIEGGWNFLQTAERMDYIKKNYWILDISKWDTHKAADIQIYWTATDIAKAIQGKTNTKWYIDYDNKY
jgi:hypothetical protein